MENYVKISIIVPVFNTGRLLFPCVRSLFNQTLKEIEIILIDDGSSKYTQRICQKIHNRFPTKIRLIRYELNRRQGTARNAGIKKAQGEFIGIVDSDDYIALDMYEKLYNSAKINNADIVDCDLVWIRKDGNTAYEVSNTEDQVGIIDFEKKKKLILAAGRMVTKIIKKSIWINHGIEYPEGITYEDNTISGLHFMYAKKMAKVKEGLYFYRYNPKSTTHQKNDSYLDRLTAAELFYKEYKERGFLEDFNAEVEYRFIELYYINSYKKISRKFNTNTLLTILKTTKRLCPNYRSNIYFKNKVKLRKKIEMYLIEKQPKVMRSIIRFIK